MTSRPLALVVENDGGTRKLLHVLLTRFGFDVDPVENGVDALLLLRHVQYDVTYLDLLLPGTNGVDILKSLERTRPEGMRRVIVLSSAPEASLQRVSAAWPDVRVIRKPFELGEVIEAAQDVVAGRTPHVQDPGASFCRRSVRAGAKSGIVVRLDGSVALPVYAYGYEPSMLEPYFPLTLDDPYPICAAMRTGRPLWIPSVAAADAQYSGLSSQWERNGSRALAVVPLLRNGRVIGAIGWSFRDPRIFSDLEQAAFSATAEDVLSGIMAGETGAGVRVGAV